VGDLQFTLREQGMPVHIWAGAAQRLHPAQQVFDGQRGDLVDGATGDGHGQRFGAQTVALARVARALAHVLLVFGAHVVGSGLAVAAGDIVQHAFELRGEGEMAAVVTMVLDQQVLVRSIEQQVALPLGQVAPGDIGGDAKVTARLQQDGARPAIVAAGSPGHQRPFAHRQIGVGHHQVGVELAAHTQPLAGGAGPVRVVE